MAVLVNACSLNHITRTTGHNFFSYFLALATRPAPKQRIANFQQTKDDSDRLYVEQFDKLILEGEPVEEDGKLLRDIGSLTIDTEMWDNMNKY